MAGRQDTWTRRVDGKPETAADTRFFDLRESGYKGPIDKEDPWPTAAARVALEPRRSW